MERASIAIFSHKIEYSDNRNRPNTPKEIFEAVLRVIESKSCELIRTKNGMYIVQYSETGPSNNREGWSEWMPVYIAKISAWSCGGIKQEEMENHLSKENQNDNN